MRLSMIGHRYQIAVIPSTLRRESSPDAGGVSGIRYTVELSGKVDRNWQKTFYLVQWDSLESFTYQLTDESRSITFHYRPEEGPGRPGILFRGLIALVKIVNASASRKPEHFILPSGLLQGAELANV